MLKYVAYAHNTEGRYISLLPLENYAYELTIANNVNEKSLLGFYFSMVQFERILHSTILLANSQTQPQERSLDTSLVERNG